jgi:hypothetical protein
MKKEEKSKNNKIIKIYSLPSSPYLPNIFFPLKYSEKS